MTPSVTVLPAASLADLLGLVLLVGYLGARWREMQAQGFEHAPQRIGGGL